MENKTFTMSGWIYQGEDSLLVDGSPFVELIEEQELSGKTVSVRYWISDTSATADVIKEQHVKILMGDVCVGWNSINSEITGYMVLDEELVIGGHNLLEELKTYSGKYLLLEIDVADTTSSTENK